MPLLEKYFPLWRIKNVRMFYILSSVYNMWFMAGIWVFIWGRFMTRGQIGLSDAITFAIGFLVELPSGVIADLMGRRKAILLGNILLTIGNLFIALSSSFMGITVWYLVWTIGYAFQSGATEALAYDSVKRINQEGNWPKIIATSTIVAKTSSLLAASIGGLLFAVWFRLPYLIVAATGLIGIFAAFSMDEINVIVKPNLWSPRIYLKQIKDGINTLLKPGVNYISLLSLTVFGTAYLYNWGLLRPLTGERFGYSPVTFPFLLSLSSLLVILATVILVKIKNQINLEKFIFVTALIYSILFFFMGFSHGWIVGGLILILLAISSAYVDQLFSQYINVHTPAEHRATTLSAVALFTKAPYVILAVLTGILAEKGLLPQFTLVVGVVASCSWLFSFFKFNQSKLRKNSV